MRVISGSAKGRRLETPFGDEIVRPTTDKVKEALFSIINFDLEDATVLDLFAGSGQLGIEALSRGAKLGYFIDITPSSVKLIEGNIHKCGFTDCSKVYRADYSSFLMGTTESFDIVFIDPPYALKLFDSAINAVKNKMTQNGIIICEHPMSDAVGDLDGYKRRDYKYGKIAITVFRKETEARES